MKNISFFILATVAVLLALLELSLCSRHLQDGNEAFSESKNTEPYQDQPFRLPKSVVPLRYKIQMMPILYEEPGFERFTAGGRVEISARCDQTTSIVKLHVKDLIINTDSIEIIGSHGFIGISQITYEPEYDFLVLRVDTNLTPNQEYSININYTAPISQTLLSGMYLDFYVDPLTQETRYVATTLFAANDARRAFPCFDEPGFKANFEIILGRRADYHSLSNMHLISSEPMAGRTGWFWDTFAVSPEMSTYLVCMIVSDLSFEEASENVPNATIHRVYAPYYFIERGGGQYSANLSVTTLTAFEEYYDMPYPLQKLDNVALPQFFFNAMENWGLMTYADRVLIYFEGETPEAQKYQLSLTVSHEVSHNMFGNLVTCQWWTYVWLNEGWATFVSHLGLQLTYPDLRPWDQFVPNIYQVALEFDQSPNTHPLANEPRTAADIGGIYDDIAYEKGASVIRMVEDFLGESVLQSGVRRYLKTWAYGSPVQDDLFASVQQAIDELKPNGLPAGTLFADVMDTWTKQSGFPLISVFRTSQTEIMLSQEQYVKNDATTGNETWFVPINIQVLTGSSPRTFFTWLTKDQTNISVGVLESELFIVNPRSIGYYRVSYNGQTFNEVMKALKTNSELQKAESASSRVKIIDDTFNEVYHGKLPLNIALEQLLPLLDIDMDYFVWKTMRKHITKLIKGQLSEETELLKEILGKKILNAMKLLGKIGMIHSKSSAGLLLKDELYSWMCSLNGMFCDEVMEDYSWNIKRSPQPRAL